MRAGGWSHPQIMIDILDLSFILCVTLYGFANSFYYIAGIMKRVIARNA